MFSAPIKFCVDGACAICHAVPYYGQGPLVVWPVFLHSPRRIEALMFLVVIAH